MLSKKAKSSNTHSVDQRLNVISTMKKLLEEKTGINLWDLGLGNDFKCRNDSKEQTTTENNWQVGLHPNFLNLCFKGCQ